MEPLTLVLLYMAIWVTVSTLVALIRKGGEEDRIVVTPFMLVVRTPIVFSMFERVRGSRLIGLLLDMGIVSTYASMAFFYLNMVLGLMIALRTRAPSGLVTPLIPGFIGVDTFLLLLPGLSLAVIAHEAFHALAARHGGVGIKSSGFILFLGVLPAAFVEPDEEELRRAPRRTRLRIYSAGILANIILFALLAGINAAVASGGHYIVIVDVRPYSAAYNASIKPYTAVKEFIVNGTAATSIEELSRILGKIRREHNGTLVNVALNVTVVTAEGKVITVVKPAARGEVPDHLRQRYEMIGISMVPVPRMLVHTLGSVYAATITALVLSYAAAINLGLALINAAPLFITDGARVVLDVLEAVTAPTRAETIAKIIYVVTLALLVPNIAV